MQIATSGVTIETMGEFQEQEFTIGDPALFLEYLRKTIYSNPKKAICQELISNARDAHREVGIPEKPVLVTLPNKFNKVWSVRDWGPGIDPTRMIDVFTKFGASTKRGGNDKNATDDGALQTGGFGIGAKTPWAYTDSFTICTRAMEGDKLVERTYIAIIAEDRKNKLMELDGSMRIIDMDDDSIDEADKHTGTTIMVDVKDGDFDDFKSYTIQVCKFWDVRPDLAGCEPLPEWPEVEEKYAGNGWAIVNEKGGYGRGYYYGNRPYAMIDGIPYPLDTSAVEDMTDEMSRLCRAGVHLYFKVNQVSVALSRESIQYDEPTQKAIRTLLQSAVDEIKVKLTAEMKAADNLWDAMALWQDIRSTFDGGTIVDSIPWIAPDGTEIDVTSNEIRGFSWHDSGLRTYRMTTGYDGVTKLKSKKTNSFRVADDILFVQNDDGTVQPSRLKIETLFDANEDLDRIIVLTPGSDLQRWKDENHLDYLNPTLLSTVEKKKKKRVKRGDGSTRQVSKIYKFTQNAGRWARAWAQAELDLKEDGGIFVEFERTGAVGYSDSQIEEIMEATGVTEVYGIPTRFLSKKGDDWEPLKDKIKEKYDEVMEDLDLKDVASVNEFGDQTINSKVSYVNGFLMNDVLPLLNDQDCVMAQWIKESQKMEELRKEIVDTHVLKLARLSGVDVGKHAPKNHPISGMYEKCKETYPMFSLMESYTVRHIQNIAQEIADYINGKGV